MTAASFYTNILQQCTGAKQVCCWQKRAVDTAIMWGSSNSVKSLASPKQFSAGKQNNSLHTSICRRGSFTHAHGGGFIKVRIFKQLLTLHVRQISLCFFSISNHSCTLSYGYKTSAKARVFLQLKHTQQLAFAAYQKLLGVQFLHSIAQRQRTQLRIWATPAFPKTSSFGKSVNAEFASHKNTQGVTVTRTDWVSTAQEKVLVCAPNELLGTDCLHGAVLTVLQSHKSSVQQRLTPDDIFSQ